MRVPHLVSVALLASGMAASAWAIVEVVRTPFVPVPAGPAVPAPEETRRATTDLTRGLSWNDPSVDPKLLERAFAPVSRPLPPDAIPKPSQIMPSQEELRRMQLEGAVTY